MDKISQNISSSVPIRTRNIRKYYRMIAEVGSGTYGRVYKAECLRTKQYVALKKFESKDDKIKEDGFPITAIREIRLLKSLDHTNVIKLREIILSKPSEKNDFRGSTFLVFDYMDHDFAGLHRNKHEFCLQELKCVQYLHHMKVIHRDLKIANLLYNNQGEVKIADFGLARMLNPSNPKYTNKVVTLWYRAPEILLGAKEYTQQIDLWSVGCIFIELAIGENLLRGENEVRQLEKIYELCGSPNNQNWPDVDKMQNWKDMKPKRNFERKLREQITERKKNIDPEFLNLLDGIMLLNPKKRFNVQQCLDHEFFKTEPLPFDISEMPKIKEECHEALQKNHKNRQQVLQSHKNNFAQRANQSPLRIPPQSNISNSNSSYNNQSKQYTSSSSNNQKQNNSNISQSQSQVQSSNASAAPVVGSSHFDNRNKSSNYISKQQNNGSNSNNIINNNSFQNKDKNNYYSNNNQNSLKYSGAQQNISLDGQINLKKQGSQFSNLAFNKKKASIQLSQDNNDIPSIEHHFDNSSKNLNAEPAANQSSKFNSFSGLASLVQKQGSVDRQHQIYLDSSGNKKQNDYDNDEIEDDEDDEEQQRQYKKSQNLSMLAQPTNNFSYSSSLNGNSDEALINQLSKLNQKRSSPNNLNDISIKKKIKDD